MRFNLMARRIMAPALGLALAATVAACSSSSSSSTTGPTSSSSSASAPASSSAPATSASAGNSAAISEIKTNWETFFNGSTPVSKKVTLLQNGQKFSSAIQDMASLGSAAGAKVTAVVLNSATNATVSYNILLNGTTALPNQTGTSVLENGVWKVGDASLCALFKLVPGGSEPAACSSSG